MKKGQLLVELDPRDYQVAVDRLQANVAQAEAQIRAETPAIPIARTTTQTSIATAGAGVANAQAQLAAAERDHEAQLSRVIASRSQQRASASRLAKIHDSREQGRDFAPGSTISSLRPPNPQPPLYATERAAAQALLRTIDQKKAELAQAESELAQASTNAPQELSIRRANIDLRRASAEAARAAVAEASLSLDYTKILAPIDGIIGRKSVEVGSRVQPGQQLLSVVPLHDIWVTANYKENQLAHMRVGQKATIHVDAYDRDFDGMSKACPLRRPPSSAFCRPKTRAGIT